MREQPGRERQRMPEIRSYLNAKSIGLPFPFPSHQAAEMWAPQGHRNVNSSSLPPPTNNLFPSWRRKCGRVKRWRHVHQLASCRCCCDRHHAGRTVTGPGCWVVQPTTHSKCCHLQDGHWLGSQAGGRGRIPVHMESLCNQSQKGRHTQM